MKLLEGFILGKNKDKKLCEDDYFLGEKYSLVVDGATSKNNIKYNGHSGGKALSLIVKEVFQKIDTDKKNHSIDDVIKVINVNIMKLYKNNDVDINKPENLSAASFIVYFKNEQSIYSVGDCQFLIKYKDKKESYTYQDEKYIDKLISEIRTFIVKSLLLTGYTEDMLLENDISRKKIEYYLKKQSLYQNNKHDELLSYYVIDGFETKYKKYKIDDIKSVDFIVLTSDGYPKVFESLEESEDYLDYVINKDPLMYFLHPSPKGLIKGNNSFDDRVYLKFI